MNDKKVTIYVSDNSLPCKKIVSHINNLNVPYYEKNVTKNSEYMKELQEQGIFGTPAIFIEGQEHAILGFQEKNINHALGVGNQFAN
jgi:glutaredoxin